MQIVIINFKGNRMLPAQDTGRAMILNKGVRLDEIQAVAERISRQTADFGGDPVQKLEAALKDKGSFISTHSVTVVG